MCRVCLSLCVCAVYYSNGIFLGDYDSARIYYEGLIQTLQRLVLSISDPMRKGKWTMVSNLIKQNQLCPLICNLSLADSAASVQGIRPTEGNSKRINRIDNDNA